MRPQEKAGDARLDLTNPAFFRKSVLSVKQTNSKI